MTSISPKTSVHPSVPLWRNINVLKAFTQVIAAILLIGVITFFVYNLIVNSEKQGVQLGFGFLKLKADITIANTPIPYDADRPYWYAFLVGVINTLRVTVIGIVLATALGVVLGVARLSGNWLISKLAAVYIGFLRHIPLIVFAFFFYFGIVLKLPQTKNALRLPGPIFLSNRGAYFVWANPSSSFKIWLVVLIIGVLAAVGLRLFLKRRQERTGKPSFPTIVPLLVFLAIAVIGWFLAGDAPLIKDVPYLKGTNFRGGLRFTPEFFAIVSCLTLYMATYIGEIVRAGIQSISSGQRDAAKALGLRGPHIFRLIVMPQALRVIIPPTISQYINLTKGTALAIVVGFSDLFVLTRNIILQSGRSAGMFILLIATYLVIGGILAGIGNLYNRLTRIVER